MLDIRDFRLQRILGRSNNIVKHGINTRTQQEVAIKCMKFPKSEEKIFQEIMNEATLLKKFQHKNIVKFYGFCYEEKFEEMEGDTYTYFYLVMEKMQYSLDEYINKLKQSKKAPPKDEATQVFFDVIEGMIYLQQEGVAHRDIKPQNIMYSYDGYWKLVDVGSAQFAYNPALSSTRSMYGTIPFFSPEMLQVSITNSPITFDIFKSDVFSLGLVFLFLFTLSDVHGLNNHLTENDSNIKIHKKINAVQQYYCPIFAELLRSMLPYDFKSRKSFLELKNQAFLRGLKPPSNLSDQSQEQPQQIIQKAQQKLELKDYQKALTLYCRGLDCINKIEDENTRDSLKTQILKQLTDLSKDIKEVSSLERIVECMKKVGFQNNVNLSDVYMNMGNEYMVQSQFQRAIDAYKESIVIRVKLLGEDSQRTSDLYFSLGNALLYIRSLRESFKAFDKAFQIRSKLLGGVDNEKNSDILHNIGVVCTELGDLEGAIQFYQQCIEIRKKIIGESNEKISDTYYNLGWTHLQLNQFDKALDNFQRSRAIRVKIIDFYTEKMAETYQQLGWAYYSLNMNELALSSFHETLNIRYQIYGQFHEKTTLVYQGLAQTHYVMKNYLAAKDFYMKMLDALKHAKVQDNPKLDQLQEDIIDCANRAAEIKIT